MTTDKTNGRGPTNALARFTQQHGNGLAKLKASEAWRQLPRTLQRNYERFGNQTGYLLHLHDDRAEKAGRLRQETQQTLVASAKEWDELIERQEDETEKLAMIQAKQNDLAAEYQAMNATLEALGALHQQQIDEAMRQPAQQWVKPTLIEHLEDVASFGEAKLERHGYPPLTATESWLNTFTFGAIADKRLREYERARILGQQLSGAADAVEEDVIDVTDFAAAE